jgi:tetratricopeptide (TPR) repeat protein
MKSMFGKRLPYFLALVAIEVIVIIVLVIWIFQGAVYDFISKSSVAFHILDFIANWAVAISGAIVLAALSLLFISFQKFRRRRAVNRLHNWARDGVVILAQYRQQNTGEADSPAGRYEEAKTLLEKLVAKAGLALADARNLRGEIYEKTREIIDGLRVIEAKLAGEDPSLFDDLQALQHNFADVMILAFEFIK